MMDKEFKKERAQTARDLAAIAYDPFTKKRLLDLSVAEAGPAFVDAGLITGDELNRALEEMLQIVEDETVPAIMLRMSQVWARKFGEGVPV